MTSYETLAGFVHAISDARKDLRRTDAVMHDINGKITNPATPHDLRTAWNDVYRDWCDLALGTPLLNRNEPRMTRDDLKQTLRAAFELKRRGLEIYGQWKNRMAPVIMSGMNGVAQSPPTPAPAFGLKNGVLRGALIAAALLGGAAAAKVLLDSFKKKPAALPPRANVVPMPIPVPVTTMAPMLVPPQIAYQRVSGWGQVEEEED